VPHRDDDDQEERAAATDDAGLSREIGSAAVEMAAAPPQSEAKKSKTEKNMRRRANKKLKKAEDQEEAEGGSSTRPGYDEINQWFSEQCAERGHDAGGKTAARSDGPDENEAFLTHGAKKKNAAARRVGRADRAADAERTAVEEEINVARKHKELGNMAFKREAYEEAADCYQEARQILREITPVDVLFAGEMSELDVALQLNMALVLQKIAEDATRNDGDAAAGMLLRYVVGYLEDVQEVDPANTKASRRIKLALELREQLGERRKAHRK
jgi:tetratricopeptide (TPR) repeat protein